MGLGIEVLDQLGHDARAGGQDELVVEQEPAVDQFDRRGLLIDALDCARDKADALVEQPGFRPLQTLRALMPKGDVHEARLVHVLAGLINDGDGRRALIDLLLEFAGEQVGDDRAANPAAQDQDSLHGGRP